MLRPLRRTRCRGPARPSSRSADLGGGGRQPEIVTAREQPTAPRAGRRAPRRSEALGRADAASTGDGDDQRISEERRGRGGGGGGRREDRRRRPRRPRSRTTRDRCPRARARAARDRLRRLPTATAGTACGCTAEHARRTVNARLLEQASAPAHPGHVDPASPASAGDAVRGEGARRGSRRHAPAPRSPTPSPARRCRARPGRLPRQPPPARASGRAARGSEDDRPRRCAPLHPVRSRRRRQRL